MQRRKPQNKRELVECVNDEWAKVDSSVLKNLYDSMEKRMNECIKEKGNNIDY